MLHEEVRELERVYNLIQTKTRQGQWLPDPNAMPTHPIFAGYDKDQQNTGLAVTLEPWSRQSMCQSLLMSTDEWDVHESLLKSWRSTSAKGKNGCSRGNKTSVPPTPLGANNHRALCSFWWGPDGGAMITWLHSPQPELSGAADLQIVPQRSRFSSVPRLISY